MVSAYFLPPAFQDFLGARYFFQQVCMVSLNTKNLYTVLKDKSTINLRERAYLVPLLFWISLLLIACYS